VCHGAEAALSIRNIRFVVYYYIPVLKRKFGMPPFQKGIFKFLKMKLSLESPSE
jgi:hypothetical protein